jgi:DNA-directed RNA polymerase specialized sigma24 family protein
VRISLGEEGRPVDGGESKQLDPQRLTAWYAAYADRLKPFLLGLLRNHALAEEALQATFAKALTHGGEVHNGSEKAWLFQVAFNEAMALRRTQGTQDKALEKLTGRHVGAEPEEDFLRWETVHQVQLALQTLPPEQLDVVTQRIYENKTFQQIADFCQLHELEVKGIADGDVALGIKGLDPVASGQLAREALEACGLPTDGLRTHETNARSVEAAGAKRVATRSLQRAAVLREVDSCWTALGRIPTASEFLRWRLTNAPESPGQAAVYRLFPGGWPEVLEALHGDVAPQRFANDVAAGFAPLLDGGSQLALELVVETDGDGGSHGVLRCNTSLTSRASPGSSFAPVP